MSANTENIIICKSYKSPVGKIVIGSYRGCLCLCDWESGEKHQRNCSRVSRGLKSDMIYGTDAVNERTADLLDEYFSGKVSELQLPLLLVGTEFQKLVWNMLMQILYGRTMSYKELAVKLGKPEAIRAVANAVACNAISIFVPCHRVVGTSGLLTGYNGGLEAKHFLLDLESTHLES